MADRERTVWVRVANGVEILGEVGERVWREPPLVRKALGELLGVFPATHVQLDLSSFLGEAASAADWTAALARSAPWSDVLKEVMLAVGSAMRPPAVWGLGLPSPRALARVLGDDSDRGILRAGLQLASFLQLFREGGIGFVALDLTAPGSPADDKPVAPLLKNASMYGWRRAIELADLASLATPHPEADLYLLAAADFSELAPLWARGDPVAGALGDAWRGRLPAGSAPAAVRLFGDIPASTDAKGIVETGRALRGWLG